MRLQATIMLLALSTAAPALAERSPIWTDIDRNSPLRPALPAPATASRDPIWTDIDRNSPLRPGIDERRDRVAVRATRERDVLDGE